MLKINLYTNSNNGINLSLFNTGKQNVDISDDPILHLLWLVITWVELGIQEDCFLLFRDEFIPVES